MLRSSRKVLRDRLANPSIWARDSDDDPMGVPGSSGASSPIDHGIVDFPDILDLPYGLLCRDDLCSMVELQDRRGSILRNRLVQANQRQLQDADFGSEALQLAAQMQRAFARDARVSRFARARNRHDKLEDQEERIRSSWHRMAGCLLHADLMLRLLALLSIKSDARGSADQ